MAYYEVGNPEAENLVILTHGMSGWACVAAAAAAPPPWRKAVRGGKQPARLPPPTTQRLTTQR